MSSAVPRAAITTLVGIGGTPWEPGVRWPLGRNADDTARSTVFHPELTGDDRRRACAELPDRATRVPGSPRSAE